MREIITMRGREIKAPAAAESDCSSIEGMRRNLAIIADRSGRSMIGEWIAGRSMTDEGSLIPDEMIIIVTHGMSGMIVTILVTLTSNALNIQENNPRENRSRHHSRNHSRSKSSSLMTKWKISPMKSWTLNCQMILVKGQLQLRPLLPRNKALHLRLSQLLLLFPRKQLYFKSNNLSFFSLSKTI